MIGGAAPDDPTRLRRLLVALGVGALALALYTRTLAPTVTLVDSGELIVAARGLGVAHPPGFPLYVLLAHAATWLPFGNIAQRVNFASAVFAALAVALLSLVVAEITLSPAAPEPVRGGKPSSTRAKGGPKLVPATNATAASALQAGAAALIAPLLFACSRTLWAYATIAEVYTLNTCLILIVLLLLVHWRRRRGVDNRVLYSAAFVFGLALGVHHVTVALTLPGLAVLVYATAGFDIFRSRRLLFAALCACMALLIYAYLPLAAARAPVLDWGDPRTLQRVWWHVTGRQYQSYFSFSPGAMAGEVAGFMHRAAREFGPWWFPAGPLLSTLGLVVLWRRDRALCITLVLIVVTNVAYGLSYVIAEDKDAYNLPAVVAAALAVGVGAASIIAYAAQHLRSRRAVDLVAGALCIVPLVTLLGNYGFNNRRNYFIADDYARNMLSTIEPGGMLLTLDWQVCAPLLYTRLVEQMRRDAVVLDVNLMRRSWYFTYLRREYPEVMERARDRIDLFVNDLVEWERDPQAYARNPALTQRIDTRFFDMLLALVRSHPAAVYVTQDIALNQDPQHSTLSRALADTYQLVPQGLVFQLFADRAYHDPIALQLATRGLADGTLRFETDDVVRVKVLPVYASMLYNRGRYLALHSQHERAAAAYQQSLALDPGFAPARRALAERAGPSAP